MKLLGIVVCSTVLSSCSSKPFSQGTEKIRDVDPIVEALNEVVEKIKDLSLVGEKEVWLKHSSDARPIRSVVELDKALNYFGVESGDRRHKLFSKLDSSESAFHFGFDCDFSVIVFFDSEGRQSYIYPESMAPHKIK